MAMAINAMRVEVISNKPPYQAFMVRV